MVKLQRVKQYKKNWTWRDADFTRYGLEGIFNSKWYEGIFQSSLHEFNNQIFEYYFDIPFEETLNRHKQKSNAHDFGEKEMIDWWNERDLLSIIAEVFINKELGLNEVVEMIYQDVIK
ncbi:hypothetical protein [Clostridium folliculivorans]|uniref:hypothetical protein n=1 Tax=Clostridium folliculivorans TaxID=2886038 RepID=UPI0021C3EDB9|nr:hypothetical protein [Clostridium folliculivorans]GKU30577.1 hypothetical protein CFB3_26840 [Clostridium folliculivorans]